MVQIKLSDNGLGHIWAGVNMDVWLGMRTGVSACKGYREKPRGALYSFKSKKGSSLQQMLHGAPN